MTTQAFVTHPIAKSSSNLSKRAMKTNATISLFATPLRIVAACLLTLAVCAPAARAADGNPPDKMSYQSYLVDAGGFPLGNTNTGPKNYDVIFRIWNDQSITTANNRLWTEQQTITVDKGYFSVVLGEGGPYSSEARPALSTLFTSPVDASDRFIEMTVRGIGPGGGDSTVLPRLRLLPTPYAFLARNANKLGNIDAANYARIDQASTFTGPVRTPTLRIDDNYASYVQDFGAGMQPVINFDQYDYITYRRAENKLAFMIGNAEVASVTSSGFSGGGTIPLGGIIMWSGSTAPNGWALCDGSTVNGRQTPDLRGRFVLASGQGGGLANRTYGQTGGEENHTLSWNEMPVHNHGVNDPGHAPQIYNDDSRAGWNSGAYYASDRRQSTSWSLTQWTGISIQNAGNGWGHNTMPPFYVLAFIMRVY